MGKKNLKLPTLFKNREWSSCNNPKTSSFRFDDDNSVYFDPPCSSRFTNTSSSSSCYDSSSLSTDHQPDEYFDSDDQSLEMVVRGVITNSKNYERLFFEPGGDTKSILKESNNYSTGYVNDDEIVPFKEESVILAMESEDPYWDFRESMEEMVESHGMTLIRDWERLEELLSWYLNVNGKKNHGFIIGAFVDLILNLTCYSSALSSSMSSSSSP
ncbi:transcription repressor OFP13-like [Rutidosis leptorrhynchoides]|uniref:transcription repressor OFP13-like n=1 Tax=Rutidosis leptorrhynchoides TaxID=125765 RepID=UPI003A99F953